MPAPQAPAAIVSTVIIAVTSYVIGTSAKRIGRKFHLKGDMGTGEDDHKKVHANQYLNGMLVQETTRGIDGRKVEGVVL